MRYLIISDLHSNLEALHAVLEAANGSYDEVVCCGDLVGYGPDPDPVVDWVRANATQLVRGNHDKACSGLMDTEGFSDNARLSAYWTQDRLRPGNSEYLKNLPQGPRDILGHFAILHGSPRDEDEYLPNPWVAAEAFDTFPQRISFFGHTHLQGGFVRTGNLIADVPLKAIPKSGSYRKRPRRKVKIEPEKKYYLNPGSVGQPRDGDNRAAYAIFDTDGFVEYGRAAYDIKTTMDKILQSGLPEFLAYRLGIGR